jgi:hypothetical protein
MSAPAPALAPIVEAPAKVRRKVVVRLADPAIVVSYLSVIFGLAVVLFPVSFPQMIVQSWWSGRLTPTMMAFAVVIDMALYLRVSHLLRAKPGFLATGILASLPIIVVVGLSLLLQNAISRTFEIYVSNAQARVGEEILTQTYFAVVSAVFLPFLIIRLSQQFGSKK